MVHTGGPQDDERWMRSRKLKAEDVQRALLALLAQQSSHGYDLIKALDTLSSGYYRPSPGVVYPALGMLEDAGRVTAVREGNRKRYELTPAGAEYLAAQQQRVDGLFQGLRHAARKMAWLRQAEDGQPLVLGPDGADVTTGWVPSYVDARMALKQALLSCSDASPAVQRRLAEILQGAAQAILRETGRDAPSTDQSTGALS